LASIASNGNPLNFARLDQAPQGSLIRAEFPEKYSPTTNGDNVNRSLNPVQCSGSVVVLIPAYRPAAALIEVVETLAASGVPAIVVVDDGSGPAYDAIFERVAAQPRVTILRHAANRGKGAALKTGIAFINAAYAETSGIVTVDADGQHHPDDVLKVCARFEESPGTLVLGVRHFNRATPLRSRLGNQLTRGVMRVVLGKNLSDTQTGLRAIPRALFDGLLRVSARGYEFELAMLMAVKHLGIGIVEQPIRTIYEPGNPTSHFKPLRDSMRIYFVLLRYSLISCFSAALDNSLFYLVFHLAGTVAAAQLTARLISMAFNYTAVRKTAFHSGEPHRIVLPQYLTLAAINVIVSWEGIRFVTSSLPIGVFPAKLLVDTLLFAANFAIQRDVVFTRRNRPESRPLPVFGALLKESAGQ
jgi:glycosyltransferase involved in cell wall biosynthesis